ncbi:hypothetical protein [Dactylosporangium sp. NPDC005555]|uniref:hypothetical protein n=1 Tax=Dactylosporangium sp. NPDC005555 TaxID=3154889 RepID=UPI0033A7360A
MGDCSPQQRRAKGGPGTLTAEQSAIAREIFEKCRRTLQNPDRTGKLNADLETNRVKASNMAGGLENIKNRYAVADITGEKFTLTDDRFPKPIRQTGQSSRKWCRRPSRSRFERSTDGTQGERAGHRRSRRRGIVRSRIPVRHVLPHAIRSALRV